mgnify:CR=1 FL=1
MPKSDLIEEFEEACEEIEGEFSEPNNTDTAVCYLDDSKLSLDGDLDYAEVSSEPDKFITKIGDADIEGYINNPTSIHISKDYPNGVSVSIRNQYGGRVSIGNKVSRFVHRD